MAPIFPRRSPYKGLIPYGEEDAQFFFGRETETRLIVANLFASSLTLLYGASGVGKSSVLRAGVAHQLRQRDDLLIVVFNAWQGDPLKDLKARIAEAATRSGIKINPPSDSASLTDYLTTCSGQLNRRLMIILDQFEEYFLYHPQDDAFAEEFPKSLLKTDVPVSFLISIREDFYAKLDRFEGRIPALYDNYLRIEHLDGIAARAAIVKPIAQYNTLNANGSQVSIEPELVNEVLKQVETGQVVLGEAGRGTVESRKSDEAAESEIETPFLQLVMTRLWDEEWRAGSNTLRLETLNRLGGAESIVRTHLDAVISTLLPDEQKIAARIFHYLVTPSGTKIAYTASDLAGSANLDRPEVVRVLEKLAHGDVRILRPIDPLPDQPTQPRYEIFHDVLAPAVLAWRTTYARAQELAEAQQHAQEQQHRADEQARIATRLRRLVVALVVMFLLALGTVAYAFNQRTQAQVFARTADAYAHESEKLRQDGQRLRDEGERLKAAGEAARKTAQMQAYLAHESQVKADLSKAEALKSQNLALTEHRRADEQFKIAKVAEKKAIAETERAEVQARATRVAFANLLAAQSRSSADKTPGLGLLLGVEALRATRADDPRVPAAEETLRRELANAGGLILGGQRPAENAGSVVATSFSPGNHWLATANTSQVNLWDLTASDPTAPPRVLENVGAPIAFSSDNHWLVTGSTSAKGDNNVRLWDLTAADLSARPLVLSGNGKRISELLISPNGRWLLTYSTGRIAQLFDLKAPGLNSKPLAIGDESDADSLMAWAISPDNHWLVTSRGAAGGEYFSDKSAGLRLWDLSATDPTARPLNLPGLVMPSTEVAFSPDSKWLVAAAGACGEEGKDSFPRLWNLNASDPAAAPVVLRGQLGAVGALAFSADSHWLATGSGSSYGCPGDASAHLWDLTAVDIAAKSTTLSGHDGPIFAIFFGTGENLTLITVTGSSLPSLDSMMSGKVNGARNQTMYQGNSTIRLWILGDEEGPGERIGPIVLRDARNPSGPVAISPNNRWLVSVRDQNALVWDLADLETAAMASPRVLHGHDGSIRAISFSADSRWLLSGGFDQTPRLWDLTASESTAISVSLPSETYSEYPTITSADRRLLVTIGNEKSAATAPKEVVVDGEKLNPYGRIARVWDLTREDPSKPVVLDRHKARIKTVALSQDNRWLVTGSEDKTTRLWDLTAADPSATARVLAGLQETIASVAFSPDNRWLITGSADGSIRLYNLRSPDPSVNPIVLRPDSQLFGYPANTVPGVMELVSSPDGRWLVSNSGYVAKALLWDLSKISPAAKPVAVLDRTTSGGIAFSADNHWLAFRGIYDPDRKYEGVVRVWDLNATDPAAASFTLRGHADPIMGMTITSDGHWLFSGSAGSHILRWDLTAPDPSAAKFTMREKTPDELGNGEMILSPDNHWLVTNKGNGDARLWDLRSADLSASSSLLSVPQGFGVMKMAIDSDSHWLILHCDTLDLANSSVLWDLTAPDPPASGIVLSGPGSLIPGTASFSYNNRWLITAGRQSNTNLWRMNLDELAGIACRTAGRNLSESEWKEYFPGQPYRKTCSDLPAAQ